jgi:hypothetical protein
VHFWLLIRENFLEEMPMASGALELAAAQGAAEAAWAKLSELQHALPDCEHVLGWREEVREAARVHRQALSARDRAYRAHTPDDAPEAGTPIR